MINKTCEYCGTAFTTYQWKLRIGKGRFCSPSCRSKQMWANRPHNPIQKYQYVRLPHHPLANKNGCVIEHRLVLYQKIGPGKHHCHWCNALVKWMPGKKTSFGALVVDHLDGSGRNNNPNNLVPSCHGCNANRSRKDRVRDDEPYIHMANPKWRHRAVKRTCKTCKREFLHLAADKRPNRGQFCSISCARKNPRTN